MEFKFTFVGTVEDEPTAQRWDVSYVGGTARVVYHYRRAASVSWRTGLNPPSEETLAAALIDHVWNA